MIMVILVFVGFWFGGYWDGCVCWFGLFVLAGGGVGLDCD